MKVREVLTKRDSLVGSFVTVEGFLRVWGTFVSISPDIASADNHYESIAIKDKDYEKLKGQLRGKVPSIVGGPVMYEYFATVTGILCESDIEPFPVALTSVTLLNLKDKKGKTWLPRNHDGTVS